MHGDDFFIHHIVFCVVCSVPFQLILRWVRVVHALHLRISMQTNQYHGEMDAIRDKHSKIHYEN